MNHGSKDMENKVTEWDIIQRAAEKDEKAMRYIYEEYSPLVWNLALKYTGNPVLAEDASASVFIRLYNKLHKFRGDSSFKTWLYRFSVNTIINFGRKEKRYTSGEMPDNYPGESGSCEEIESRDILRRLLKKLPKKDEKLIILREMQGMSYKDIADIMNLNLSTVKTRIFRARVRLRELYEEEL